MSECNEAKNSIIVTLKNSAMEAYINLVDPKFGSYTYDQILDVLQANGVTYGIHKAAIEHAIRNRMYCIDILIASGVPPKNGENGYFEYFFEQTLNSKPKVLEDGSVDYYATTHFITVSEGDKLIEYHPAQPGTTGHDVTGKEIKATNGKDLSIIKGKGFTLSEDRRIYTASITGKLDYQNDHLLISKILEIKQDVDLSMGHIHFKGDLMIYGNVESGMYIEADGNITIRGHVDHATIIAGKDVVFESGMQGAGKGVVISGGSIRGKFFEQVDMKAEKEITANAIMNCTIEAGEMINITGKRGVIVGGTTSALETITASIIGNAAGVKTKLSVGIPDNMSMEFKLINQKLENRQRRSEQIADGIAMIEEREVHGAKNPYESQKLGLLRAKINTNSEIAELQQQKAHLLDKLKRSRDAKIIAQKAIYPAAIVSVNGVTLRIEQPLAEVVFVRHQDQVQMQIL